MLRQAVNEGSLIKVARDSGMPSSMHFIFYLTFGKMVHFAPRWNGMGAEEFVQIFVQQMFRLHGISKPLVSDRDKLLTFLNSLLKPAICLVSISVC